MARRNWKRVSPTSLRHGMELCLKYANEKHNRSVDRIADLMGLTNKWPLYKWLENGRMPAILIRPFEHACDATYMTQYIATSAHKLVVDIPSGKPASNDDVLALQTGFNEAVNHLAKFYQGKADAAETMAALDLAMADIAGHRANVAQELPELDLFNGGAE